LERENKELRHRLGRHQIVWVSPAMREVMAQVDQVAASETRVCIRGETGTGKELIARTLHEKSPRKSSPFVSLNCAAVPAELMESELFGHEKGSFTGAAARHIGKFEQAHRGTLFLDEIGDMPMAMQAKLLRVLEEGEIERVGGGGPFAVNVRVIVATHRNLEEQVRERTFRDDLYHRVFVFPIVLPPLRERREDIPALAEHFSKQLAEQNHWKLKTYSPEALAALEGYAWPGNVRELRNVIERVLLYATGEVIEPASIARALPQGGAASAVPGGVHSDASVLNAGTLSERVEAFERQTLLAELKQHRHHMTNTAKALGLERSHLYKKCQQLGIDLRAVRQHD
jgi:two-component system, NtrC family, nitrogen regulation response regulator NtrX